MQLEHCQQLLSMQENELASESMIVRELCNALKQYHFILQGSNMTTEAMVSYYEVSFCYFQLNGILCSLFLFLHCIIFPTCILSCFFIVSFSFFLFFLYNSFLSVSLFQSPFPVFPFLSYLFCCYFIFSFLTFYP
jgi:hypothetical protein